MLAALVLSIAFQTPSFPRVETAFDSVRRLSDQISITESRGAATSSRGVPLATLRERYQTGLARLRALVARVRQVAPADSAALTEIRRWTAAADAPPATALRCDRPVEPAGLDRATLESRMLACYAATAGSIVVGIDTLDRLSILGLLSTTDDRMAREQLFRALEPVWTSVNAHDEPGSPYRSLLALRREGWRSEPDPVSTLGASFGLSMGEVEEWITSALSIWRLTLADSLIEPWDYWHLAGAAGRRLGGRVHREDLIRISERFYRSLGADPARLGVHYDLEPRAGKYPVAFTEFGGRSVARGGRWQSAEPWVFASYRLGGLENLAELLHETGHAVHIAAIRTRPVWADWPDSDPFTEGVADLAALEIYEPRWQQEFLGDSASLAESLRAKYAGIMLDKAWTLFELRVHRPDAPSPNQVWADITSRYLGIRPHPELAWWALRGQLIDGPGYLGNYALGAFLVADLREAVENRFGPIATGRSGWYEQVSRTIYRFGRERPAKRVVAEMLGRPVRPGALLRDLARLR